MKLLYISAVLGLFYAVFFSNVVYAENNDDKANEVIFLWVRHDKFGDHVTYSDLPPVDSKHEVKIVSTEISFSNTLSLASSKHDGSKNSDSDKYSGNFLSGSNMSSNQHKMTVGYISANGRADSIMSARDAF